jgi:hypothetical protein
MVFQQRQPNPADARDKAEGDVIGGNGLVAQSGAIVARGEKIEKGNWAEL